jgi:hypothetical protein
VSLNKIRHIATITAVAKGDCPKITIGFSSPALLYRACTALVAFFLSVGCDAKPTYFSIYLGICFSWAFVSLVIISSPSWVS